MSNDKTTATARAIIVADCISPNSVLHQLLANYKNTPAALLPVCNRPLIDYVIENLVQNEIREITVLCANHLAQVEAHVRDISEALENQQRRHVKDLESDTQSIRISCRPSRVGHLRTLENVFHEVRNSPMGSEPFVLVPIDCITNVSNLKSLFDRHLARAHAASKNGGDPVVFTAVVQRDDRSLRHALNSLMADHQSYPTYNPNPADDATQAASDRGVDTPMSYQTPTSEWQPESILDAAAAVSSGIADSYQPEAPARTDYMWGDSDDEQQGPPCLMVDSDSVDGGCTRTTSDAANGDVNDGDSISNNDPSQIASMKLASCHVAAAPRVTVAFDPTTQITYGFQAWHDDESNPPMALPKMKRGQRLSIRTDLMLSGILICSPTVIGASAGPPTSVISLMTDLVVSYEAKKNRFAIDYTCEDSVVLSISSLQSYVLANRAVGNRLLYPLTREAVFVGDKDDETRYVVAINSNHVTLRKDFLPVPVGIGGCCTLGGGIRVEADVVRDDSLTSILPCGGSLTSTQQQLPPNCKALVRESIIGDDVVLGNGCTVIGSVILAGAHIGDHVTIINSLVGSHAHVGIDRTGSLPDDDLGAHISNSIVVESGMVFVPNGSVMVHRVLTSEDTNSPVLAPPGIVSTQGMLVADIDRNAAFPVDEESRWNTTIRDILALFIDDERRTSETWVNSFFAKALGDKRLEFQKTNQDLICTVMHQLIIEAAHRQVVLASSSSSGGGGDADGAQSILDMPEEEIDGMVYGTKAIFDSSSDSDNEGGGVMQLGGGSSDSDDDSSSSSSSASSSDNDDASSASSASSGGSSKTSSSTADAPPLPLSPAVQLIKRLLCMWFGSVFCKFASMDTSSSKDQKENSYAICMGIALGLNDTNASSSSSNADVVEVGKVPPPSLTDVDANKIMGLIYSNLSDGLFEQQKYCIVPGKWLRSFDSHLTEMVLDAEADNELLCDDIKTIVGGWKRAELCVSKIRAIIDEQLGEEGDEEDEDNGGGGSDEEEDGDDSSSSDDGDNDTSSDSGDDTTSD